MFIDLPLIAVEDKATTATVTKNSNFVEGVRALSTSEAANTLYTGANAVVEVRKEANYPLSEIAKKYFTSSTVAAVKALLNSAVSGVSGNGQVALVAGTKAITIPGITSANNKAFVQLVTPNTASSTIQYKAVITNDTLTITALVAAGTINVADISTVSYFVL